MIWSPTGKPVVPFCMTLLRSNTFVFELRRVIRSEVKGLLFTAESAEAAAFSSHSSPVASFCFANQSKTTGVFPACRQAGAKADKKTVSLG